MPTQEEFDALKQSHNNLLNKFIENNTADQILFSTLFTAAAVMSRDGKQFTDGVIGIARSLAAQLGEGGGMPAALLATVETRIATIETLLKDKFDH